ncbi:MAG: hypothetical protein ACXWGX_13915 [Usitatibacter sp.]
MPTRRQFIKVGLAGAAILAATRCLEGSQAATATGFQVLDARTAAVMAAMIPVVLSGSLPGESQARARAIREVVEAFDRAVAGLSPAVQNEVDQLFGVLRFAPVRIALTGLWDPVELSSAEEIAAFLTRWRHSRFGIQRAGYQALTQLIQASWFGSTASWAAIGYPGPPSLAAQ